VLYLIWHPDTGTKRYLKRDIVKDFSSGAKIKNNPRHQVPCRPAPELTLLFSNSAKHREKRERLYYGDASNVMKLSLTILQTYILKRNVVYGISFQNKINICKLLYSEKLLDSKFSWCVAEIY
jgi:hypothetical protein